MILYKTVLKEAQAEQVIERSRFISYVRPVESREEADAFLAEIRARHRDATHNVPAFVIGDKMQQQWASDDGEPQGTSGAPVVQMLVKEELTNLAVVVTRYFGGVKLGTGGLVRAYTSSAKLAVEAAGIAEAAEMCALTVKTDYAHLAKLQKAAGALFRIDSAAYAEAVHLTVFVEPEQRARFTALLGDLTGGSAQILSEETKVCLRAMS